MKKILLFVFGVTLLSLSSCFETDNWDAPDCTWQGTVTDSYTGQPILASQNDWQIRIWERSFTGQEGGATNFQDLRIKQDGTYQNTKLFAGTYDMLPYNGPFWPMDTLKNLVLKDRLVQDFEVTPYLQVLDVRLEQFNRDGKDSIRVVFKVKAPVLTRNGATLPRLYELRVFLSYTPFVGNGNDSSIGVAEYTNQPGGTVGLNSGNGFLRMTLSDNGDNNWTNLIANGPGDNTTADITFSAQVKKGYTYYYRAGASVNDTYRKFCYSPISSFTVQ
ncbi:MAG: DUF3823 domain-containing protein [Tannerella sp.]|jgi:hypothetical protein|nr:DUF3823 domain-containing protein [Tannerella sp.]